MSIEARRKASEVRGQVEEVPDVNVSIEIRVAGVGADALFYEQLKT